MELFHFDIETCGNYSDFDSFKKLDERGADLFEKKYHKMEWDKKYDSIHESYIDNAGIVSTYGRICCISFGYISNDGSYKISSFFGQDEEKIVNDFNDLLKKIELKDFNLCGFRINYFDIPYVLHKLHKYNIKPANIINPYYKKPWDMRITDISDDWRLKFAWAFSFDEVCYELNIPSPKDIINGSNVHGLYWNGEIDKIKNYCEKDVKASLDISKYIY